MEFFQCSDFSKDFKKILKSCPKDYKEVFKQEIREYLVGRVVNGISDYRDVLRKLNDGYLLKIRVKDCNNKGRRGGYRVVLVFNLKTTNILLVKVYKKSDKENIPVKELLEILGDCIRLRQISVF
jgi:mRNA-degrading endonuclease RelE of RelBE toxin-antitoxin system